jgi:hypothetical protein
MGVGGVAVAAVVMNSPVVDHSIVVREPDGAISYYPVPGNETDVLTNDHG